MLLPLPGLALCPLPLTKLLVVLIFIPQDFCKAFSPWTSRWCCSSPFTRSSSLPSSSQKVADTITVTLVGETTGALGETSTKVQDKASWSWAPFCALEWRIWSLEDIRYVPSLVHCLVSLRSLGYHHDEYIHGTDGRRVPHFIACEFQYSRAIGRAVFDLLLTGELHSFIMKRVWWSSCLDLASVS